MAYGNGRDGYDRHDRPAAYDRRAGYDEPGYDDRAGYDYRTRYADEPGYRRSGGRRNGRGSGSWWRRRSRLAKFGYIMASVVTVIAVVAGATGYAIYRRLDGNITVLKVHGLSGKTVYGALNILVLGSQERQGQKGHFGKEADPWTTNSDNLLLIHLDPTHTHATVLSIPRDTMVYEPGCQARIPQIGIGIQGPYTYPPGSIIDGALNIGGPACAVSTVEDLTGIKLDHFVEFDFNSFRTMVDTLGGVEVCVPPGPGYHDQASGVNLRPGKHLLKYNQALAYVRTRHDLGGADAGGDLPRIELQQAFISSVIQQVNATGLLGNVPRLLSIADTATKALTVDSGLGTVASLLTLARSLVHLKSKNVSLITMPTATDAFDFPTYSARLVTVQPEDDVLFNMIRTGQAWTGHLPTEPDGEVQVRVLNATGEQGLAARTAAKLRRLGFDVTSVGDAPATSITTVDYRGLVQSDGAYTLMTALKSAPAGQDTLAEPTSQVGRPGPVTLVLGTNFAGVNPPAPPAATHLAGTGKQARHRKTGAGQPGHSGPGAVQSRNAAANICSGLPSAN